MPGRLSERTGRPIFCPENRTPSPVQAGPSDSIPDDESLRLRHPLNHCIIWFCRRPHNQTYNRNESKKSLLGKRELWDQLACWSAAATIAALIRSSSMPIAGWITSDCPILNRSSCAKRADIEAPMSGRISARLRSGPARGVSSRRHASGPDHSLGPLGMAKIERGGDSWQKPARARFAHRRGMPQRPRGRHKSAPRRARVGRFNFNDRFTAREGWPAQAEARSISLAPDAARARYNAQKAPMMAAPSIRMIRSVAIRCLTDGWVMAESLHTPHSRTDHGRPL